MMRRKGVQNLARRGIKEDVKDQRAFNENETSQDAEEAYLTEDDNSSESDPNLQRTCTTSLYPDIPKAENSEEPDDAEQNIKRTHKQNTWMQQINNFSSYNSELLIKWLCVFFVGIIIFVSIIYIKGCPSQKISELSETVNIAALMTGLKNEYANQLPVTFRIIQGALKSVVHSENPRPAIIMLLVPENAKDEGFNIGHKIAREISSQNYAIIWGEDLKHLDPDGAKKKIDDELRNNFSGSSALKVALVNGLQDVPSEAVMIFSSFCDDETAEFKRAVYIMIVYSDQKVTNESQPKDWEKLASKILRTAWVEMHIDQWSSLQSRITGRVVAIL